MPRVSVIIPFLDAGSFLAEALDSVLAQTHDDWEVLLVDDGTTDESRLTAKCYADRHPSKVRVLEHPGHVNRGLPASRNLAMRHARGELIALLDADDWWKPEKLERQIEVLDAHPRAGMVCGPSRYWKSWDPSFPDGDWTPELGIEPDRLYGPRELTLRMYPLGSASPPCPSNLLLRRSTIEGVGGFEEAFHRQFTLYEDQAFLSKVYLRHWVWLMSETLTLYRIHDRSCDSQVVGAGKYDEVRSFFMAWYEASLVRQGITDRRIWMAFRAAAELSPPGLLERWLPGRLVRVGGDEQGRFARFLQRQSVGRARLRERDRLLNQVLIASYRGDRRRFLQLIVHLGLVQPQTARAVLRGCRQSNRLEFLIGRDADFSDAGDVLDRSSALRLIRLHPTVTEVGKPFNVQRNGSAALAVECERAAPDTVIVFGDVTLETRFASPELLTARVPESLYQTPGRVPVFLRSRC